MKIPTLVFLSFLVSGALSAQGSDHARDFQETLDAGKVLVLEKGEYRLERTVAVDLTKSGFAAIRGDGTARVIMAGPGPAFRFVGTHTGSADPEQVKEAIWAKERAPMVEGIEIVGAHPEADGIEATGTMQLTVSRVVVRKCRHAIHLTNRNRNLLISDCHLYENGGIGIFYDQVNLHQSNITGCHISYNRGGGIVSRGGNVRNIHIGSCDLEGNHDSTEGAAPTANIWLDSRGGSVAEVAITGSTIQHTHKAPGSANIRIDGRGVLSDADPEGGAATREGHVAITGNVMSDAQVNVMFSNARGVTVSGNTFWEGFEHDLLVRDSEKIVVTGNNFDRNPRYRVNGNSDTEKNGLFFGNCRDCIIGANMISGVRHRRAALDLVDCARFNVAGNSLLDNDGLAIRLEGVTESMVRGNLLRDDRKDPPRQPEALIEVLGGGGNVIEP
jgi:hypothetical protein